METLFEKLPNKETLYNWITLYAGFEESTYSEPTSSLKYILRFWETNKQNLYKLLDDQYIYEKEIQYEKPLSELEDDMTDFLYSEKGRLFKTEFKNWIRDWVDENFDDRYQYFSTLHNLVCADTLTKNYWPDPSLKIEVNGQDIQISYKSKISKILGKIAKAANIKGYEDFRIGHSQILNQRKQTGILCFSIHPLDYFTMSDNEYGWDSCMNWRNNGCYRIGTVEMCNSPYVVVCYLKGDKRMRFYDSYWNSKKWRNLFIVDKDIITGIKGYPYQNTILDTFCVNTLKDLAKKNLNWEFEDTVYEHCFDYESENVYLEEKNKKISFQFSTSYMYNDFGNHAIAHFVLSPNICSDICIDYSGLAVCMCCGEELYSSDIGGEECLLCGECSTNIYCACCDRRLSSDDVYELDGETLCKECYLEHRVTDAITEEEHHDENCFPVFLISDEENNAIEKDYYDFIDGRKYIMIYQDTENVENYFKCGIHLIQLNHFYKSGIIWTERVRVVYESECTPRGKDIFDFYGRTDY